MEIPLAYGQYASFWFQKTMNIHPIRTKADYENTLDRIEAIFEATPNTPEFDELEILTLLWTMKPSIIRLKTLTR